VALRTQRAEQEPRAGDRRVAREQRAPDPAVATLLQLQRGAGNQAVARVLARRTQKPPPSTGMRAGGAIGDYVRKAVIFLRNNPDAQLHHFARFLGAAANTELERLGVPDMKVRIDHGGKGGAHFDAELWEMYIDADGFTHRDGVTTLGQLTEDEAAIIAMSVYHEARHAEQRFRVARLQAGEGAPLGFRMDEDAAKAAAAKPLDKRATPAHELREAEAWRTNQMGDDALYREVVTQWQGDVTTYAKLARGVADEDGPEPSEVHERIGRVLKGWAKPDHAMDVVRKHLPSAQKRRNATIIADITLIDERFTAAEAEWKALPAQPGRGDFAALAEALRQLVRAINGAYRNQPIEKDAYEAGGATFDAFHKELAKRPAAG